ncbi:MAG: FixH family protein [Labilithrix sp.]|nr:FixH family protein [Labilithrix sp.]
MQPAALFTVAALALALSGCSSEDPGASSGGGRQTACEKDTRKDIYVAGLSKQNAGLSVKLVESTPAPPAKLTNAMTFQVLDGAGKPLDGATVSVVPFMPDHGHGSQVAPVVTPKGNGTYEVANIYLAMAGLWRITVSVQTPGGAPQEIAFQFCVDG